MKKLTTLILLAGLLLSACGGGDPDPCPGDAQLNANGQCVEPMSAGPSSTN